MAKETSFTTKTVPECSSSPFGDRFPNVAFPMPSPGSDPGISTHPRVLFVRSTRSPRRTIIRFETIYNGRVKHIRVHLKKSIDKSRKTERGELLEYFCERLNRSRKEDGLVLIAIARMAKMLEKIPTKDLYYLKSVCARAPNFSKKFWWEIKPENHKQEGLKPTG